MKDLIVVVMTVAFFAVCVAYVALCDRIIGPDDEPAPDTAGAVEPQEVLP